MNLLTRDGLKFFRFPALAIQPNGGTNFRHYITTRTGGTSHGHYCSLNLGFHVNDQADKVLANRRRLCQTLGISLKNLTVAEQVHGSRVKIVSRKDIGRGAATNRTAIRNVDALITNEPGAVLMTLSADCPLILCVDPVRQVIANIHASWRSLGGGIIRKTIDRMVKRFGCRPSDIRVGISPAIGSCCYEVQDDFIKSLKITIPFKQNRHLIRRKQKKYFNLSALIKYLLRKTGLKAKHIETVQICTRCHPELFYSYRRDGAKTGRFGALIWIPQISTNKQAGN